MVKSKKLGNDMSIDKNKQRYVFSLRLHLGLIYVFIICFVYWMYLFFSSHMLIKHDALCYYKLGTMIKEHGMKEFFITGPNREPLYPLMVAYSMKIADYFSIHYQQVQKLLQIFILFISQILVAFILQKIGVTRLVLSLAVLYMGLSPAVVNSAFSLYSEIAAYPFVLMIILCAFYSWDALVKGRQIGYIIMLSLLTGFAFVCASFVKAIFQYIFVIFIIIFMCLIFNVRLKKKKDIILSAIIYILVCSTLFFAVVLSYRFINKIYNGRFDFTNRYDVLLFGNAAKRVDKLNKRLFIAHILSVPGGGVCRKIFDEDTCRYPEFHYADIYWPRLLPGLLGHYPTPEDSSKIISLSFSKIMENPLQYLFLTGLEAMKMAFWESTQIGFVDYPMALKCLFDNMIFKNMIRMVVSSITYIAIIYTFIFLCRSRYTLNCSDDSNNAIIIVFFILAIIIPFTLLYSMYSILARFALPIVPLYIIIIAFFFDRILKSRRHA